MTDTRSPRAAGRPGPRLIVLEGDTPREVVPETDRVEVGRDPEMGLVLFHQSVSRHHAVLSREAAGFVLEDTGSTFGTFVNERPMRRGERVALQDGDVVRFGQVRVVCRGGGATAPESLADAVFAAQANARLLILEGESVRRRPIAGAATLIGCGAHCEVRLGDRRGPAELALIRALDGAFRLEPRGAPGDGAPRLNEQQELLGVSTPLASNSAIVVPRAQVLFLYDFGPAGTPVPDPLAALPRRWLLRQIAAATGVAPRELEAVARGLRTLGQRLGESLVERRVVTPLFWRVTAVRLLEEAPKTSGWSLRRLWGGKP